METINDYADEFDAAYYAEGHGNKNTAIACHIVYCLQDLQGFNDWWATLDRADQVAALHKIADTVGGA